MRISWSIGSGKSFGHVPPVGMTLEKLILIIPVFNIFRSGEPGLVDRLLALHAGSRGFDSNRGHTSERFFQSNRQGYPHPVNSEPPPTFSDTAITDRHLIPLFSSSEQLHWVRISWSIGSEKSFGHVPTVGVEPSTSCMQGEHPIH